MSPGTGYPPLRRALLLAALGCWLGIDSDIAFAESKARFSIPPGPAENTLHTFARQSGAIFIVSADKVRGIRTNNIKGEYSPKEALELMLQGSVLRAVVDDDSGIMTVDRVQVRPMEHRAPPARPDGVQPMSPVEVKANPERGYRAGAVGVGTRLGLDLSETPVAYSAINRTFIDSVGVIGVAEAASWGAAQAFRFTGDGAESFGSPIQFNVRGQLIENRGVATEVNMQRNYFPNNTLGDEYNVESFDFGRGPNAILFGTGAFAGIGGQVSSQTKKVRFDTSGTSVTLSVGEWGYRRATIDANRRLNSRIGYRVNAVTFDRRGPRIGDLERTRGVTFSGQVNLTNTTEILLEASQEKTERQNAALYLIDGVSGWDGATVFRGPVTNSMLSTSSVAGPMSSGESLVLGSSRGLTFNGEPNGIGRVSSPYYLFDHFAGTVTNYQNSAYSRAADSTSRVPLYSRSAPNGSYFLRGTMPQFGSATGNPVVVGQMILYQQALPPDRFERAIANSRFRIPDSNFTALPNAPVYLQQAKDLQVGISQRLGRNISVELGGDINRLHNQVRQFEAGYTRTGAQRIDLNVSKPDGTPNPGFLDVYADSVFGVNDTRLADQAVRLNLAYTLNLGEWGRYSVNVNGNASQRTQSVRNYSLSMMLNPDSRLWGLSTEQVRDRNYWRITERPYNPPEGVPVRFTQVTWSNPESPVIEEPVARVPRYVLANWSETFLQNRYAVVQATGRYFSGKLVVSGAVRRELASGIVRNAVALGDLPAGWNGNSAVFRPDAPSDYFSLARNRPRASVAGGLNSALPEHAKDRFRDDFNPPRSRLYSIQKNAGLVLQALRPRADRVGIAPFVNFATSYTPMAASGLNLLGEMRTPARGRGYDYGINLDFFDARLTAKLNFYSNRRDFDLFSPMTSTAIDLLYQSNRFDNPDTTELGRNARGAGDLPGLDYQGFRSEGREVDIAANISPGWRTIVNGGWSQHTITDFGPLTRQYVPANAALFRQILEDAGGTLDTSRRPENAPHAPGIAVASISTGGPLVDQSQAINAYNNIWIQYETLLGASDIHIRDQPSVNFYTDYTLQSGRLRGLRLGFGVQWQGSATNPEGNANYANATVLDPNNPVPTAIPDPRHAPAPNRDYFYLKGPMTTVANIGYAFSLRNGDSIDLNLRINNPVNDRTVTWMAGAVSTTQVYRQPNADYSKPDRVPVPGAPNRYPERRNFRLSLRYSFGDRGK